MSLNDPHWGRGPSEEEKKPTQNQAEQGQASENKNDTADDRTDRDDRDGQQQNAQQGRDQKGQGDDLDRLWDEFNRALGGLLGPTSGRPRSDNQEGFQNQNQRDGRDSSGFTSPGADQFKETMDRFKKMGAGHRPQPSGKGIVFAVIAALGLWGATGFYIVPEGQSGIVTTFGKYTETTMPGFRWHLPVPVQSVDIVDVSSVRTVEVGAIGRVNREAEALMLTDDENIVDLRFNVQYRIKPGEGAMNYIFRSKNPDESVLLSAESAMREVIGRMKMDSVLFESKQEIADAVKKIMQEMLDRYLTGIEVMSVAIQNAQPPQPVQAAFNDAVKAGQDRERQINEGQAYANAVIPKARGMAARLTQEAEGYKARVTETATGDADRFTRILQQYEKAPQVTRDRMYVDVMQQVFSSATKVFVDTKDGNNLLYLPFDKLMEQNKTQAVQALQADGTITESVTNAGVSGTTQVAPSTVNSNDIRDIRSRMR